MMNRNIFLFFLELLLICSSCKKEDDVYVKGRITDNINNAVEGVEVGIYAKKVNYGIYSDNYSKITSTTTQSDGSYELNFKWLTSDDFVIRLSKEHFYSQENSISSADIYKGNTLTKNYSLVPKGYAKIKVVNQYGNSTASVKVWTNNTLLSEVDCCPNYAHMVIGAGYPYENEWTCSCAANSEFKLSWVVNTITPSSTQAYDASQYIEPAKTYDFVIAY